MFDQILHLRDVFVGELEARASRSFEVDGELPGI